LGQGPEQWAQTFLLDLRCLRAQEVAGGMTLLGPQGDALEFHLQAASAAGYASRAQERTLALALRLAAARYLQQVRGGPNVLRLLDDVMSEMEACRRRHLLGPLLWHKPAILTATELEAFPSRRVAAAAVSMVAQGEVTPVSGASVPDA